MSKDDYLSAMGIEVYRLRSQQESSKQESSNAEITLEISENSFSSPDQTINQALPPAASDAVVETQLFEGMDLDAVAEKASRCELCSLSRSRNSVVFGSGAKDAKLMFIGEGPGAEEDRQGLPFVGKAGQLLSSMIFALGFEREEVYICNVVKCRPPNNRDPSPTEAKSCEPYLRKQIELIQPKVIVALGRISAQLLLDTELPLSNLRRQTHKFKDTQIDLVVTYHPAYLLRKPTEKAKSWEDLWKVWQMLKA